MTTFFIYNKMILKNDIERIYKIVAYVENVLDLLDDIELKPLSDKLEHLKKSCINFQNRLESKKSKNLNAFLLSIFEDEKTSLTFNEYRNEIDETLSFILNLQSIDYTKLKYFRNIDIGKELIVMKKKDIRTLVVDSKLSTIQTDKFLEQWLQKKI